MEFSVSGSAQGYIFRNPAYAYRAAKQGYVETDSKRVYLDAGQRTELKKAADKASELMSEETLVATAEHNARVLEQQAAAIRGETDTEDFDSPLKHILGYTVMGVGSTFSYMYDTGTGRLSAENGETDAFADYFNGESKEAGISAADSDAASTLNGYDRNVKAAINKWLDIIPQLAAAGLTDALPEGAEIGITGEISDAATVSLNINGRSYTGMAAMSYLPEELAGFTTIAPTFKTREHRDYDPTDNSVHIAVGDSFSYGRGYSFTVEENMVIGEGYDGHTERENAAADRFKLALDSLIHFGDGQYMSSMIERDMTPMLVKFLNRLGVDTDREFTVNDTRCEIVDGRIKEVGNRTGVPSGIYNRALARYEKNLAAPLA